MRATTQVALAVLAAAGSVSADHAQIPFQPPASAPAAKRELKGRFMHITDFHPDPHYKKGATLESGCHRAKGEKKGGKGKGKGKRRLDTSDKDDGNDGGDEDEDEVAGPWGVPVSDCDSPIALIDLAFSWFKKEWVEEVDFVVWTGDSARHDIDRVIPRSGKEIYELNQMMAERMLETFGKKIPIIPSLGNNDIYPHNILPPGPNEATHEFLRIWKHFIPEEQRHVFERGAYFAVEVIPDQLAVISLNTIFFFTNNAAVDGCKVGSGEAGDLEMEWLEVQLGLFRDRGMQVHLIGHVAPHEGMYYDDCYLRYGDLALRYQDTIVGHHFGHQNIDHFFFLSVPELEAVTAGSVHDNGSMYLNVKPEDGTKLSSLGVSDFVYDGPKIRGPHFIESGRFKTLGHKAESLVKALKKAWDALPGPSDLKHKDYAVINVAPSIIPTYLPSARIYSYNISGVSLDATERNFAPVSWPPDDPLDALKKKRDCEKRKNQNKPHCTFPTKPRYSSPESPSRKNKALSILGYTQFFVPDLDTNSNTPPSWEMEYTTFEAASLLPPSLRNLTSDTYGPQPPPVPYHLLPGYDPDIVSDLTPEDIAALAKKKAVINGSNKKSEFLRALKKVTPWQLDDLTIKNYVKFARKLSKRKKAWKKFIEFMFVSSGGN